MQPFKIFSYQIRCVSPFWNLAFEEYLFKKMVPSSYYLIQWVSAPCVVIGRFQNPWKETNLLSMEKDRVLLVRRFSGGGTVYQDLGNSNYSFLAERNDFNKRIHREILESALKKLNLNDVNFGERGDIFLGKNKISGCAYRQTKEQSYQHGTMLINSDIELLYEYLNFNSKKDEQFKSNAILSRKNQVINLSEIDSSINVEKWQNTLSEEFSNYFKKSYGVNLTTESVIIDEADFSFNQEVTAIYNELISNEWIWNQTPTFKFVDEKCGEILVEKGKIVAVEKNPKLIGERFSLTFFD